MEIKQISEIDPEKANIEYVDLMNKCFNLNLNYSDRLFIKKHIKNPFGKSFGNFIYKNDKLIATNFNLRWEFISNGKVLKAVQSVDTMVDPDFQRQGIFRKGVEDRLKETPSDLLRFGFPNSNSKPAFLKWGWKLSSRYVTKIYPISWIKFIRKRLLEKQKDFKSNNREISKNILSDKILITEFLTETNKNTKGTNFSYELLTWKLSLNQNLNTEVFKRNDKIIAILIYSICEIENYSLLRIFALLKKDNINLQPLIKDEMKKFIKEKSIDEVQYTGTNHDLLENLFTAVKSKNADMILHSDYGNREELSLMQSNIDVSIFVTDHF